MTRKRRRKKTTPKAPRPVQASRSQRGSLAAVSRGAQVSGLHRKAAALGQGGYAVSFGGDHGPRRASYQRHVTRTRRTRDQAARRPARKAAR